MRWAPSSELVSSSTPSWQILTAHAQPFRGAKDLAVWLKVPLDSLLVWASSGGSGGCVDKYQIRLTRPRLWYYHIGDSPEHSLFAHMKYGSRRKVRPKIRHLTLLDGCACAFEKWDYGGRNVPQSQDMAQLCGTKGLFSCWELSLIHAWCHGVDYEILLHGGEVRYFKLCNPHEGKWQWDGSNL